jgi:heme/copper-type cytochrome/quinol oxidase subunit 1
MSKIKKQKRTATKEKIMLLIILFFVVFLGSGNVSFAQADTTNTQEKYIGILEKVNQQLSLRWNPYNTILTILTALFAIFTVVFGLVIYVQSRAYKRRLAEDKKEYEKKIDKFLKRQERHVKKLIDERNAKVKKIEGTLSKIISEYEKKLAVLSKAPKKQKHKIEKIEKAIEELKTEKELLKSQVGPIAVTPDYNHLSALSMWGQSSLHRCSKCGFGFKINRLTSPEVIGGTITCPKCGNIDQI